MVCLQATATPKEIGVVEVLLLILAVYIPVRLLFGPRRSAGGRLTFSFDRERMRRQWSLSGGNANRKR